MSNLDKVSANALTRKLAQLRENARNGTGNSPESSANASKQSGKQRKTYVQGRGHLAYWAVQSLKTGEAAICLDCAGTGKGRYDLCDACQGKGAVCPTCHGFRFIKVRKQHAAPYVGIFEIGAENPQVHRCPDCCEGNNVNELLELACIKRYIARSDAVQTTMEGETHP